MDNEIDSLIDNSTFTDVSKSSGGRWVYSIKDGPNDEELLKARYVAKGYNQVKGKDYFETFAPTAKMSSLRILMQISAHNNLLLHQMDVKAAYLNAEIDCDIYVEAPEGYRQENIIWKLQKSLYGLKQSGRNWNFTIHNFLTHHKFVR